MANNSEEDLGGLGGATFLPELWISYLVGGEENPTYIAALYLTGRFRLDIDALKLAAKQAASGQIGGEQSDEIYLEIRDKHVRLLGPIWYDILLFVGGAAASGLIGDAATSAFEQSREGVKALWRRLHPGVQMDNIARMTESAVAARPQEEQPNAILETLIHKARIFAERYLEIGQTDFQLRFAELTSGESPSRASGVVILAAPDGTAYRIEVSVDGGGVMVTIRRLDPS